MKRILAMLLTLELCGCTPRGTEAVLPVSAEEAEERPCVALTFDDGPSRYTAQLLDGLRDRGVQATFFLLGCHLEGNEELVRRMQAEGHQIGCHAYSHTQLTTLPTESALEEVARCDLALCTLLGEGDYWLRPPYGSISDAVLEGLDVPVIGWSVDPRDWESQNADDVLMQVVRKARDGDVILLHDCYASTVEAALRAVDRLREQGFDVVTVAELLRRKGIEVERGRIYHCGR